MGSLLGGKDQEQDIVVFDPGKAELLPPEKEKLHNMAEMLKNRPQLRLNVKGHYSPDADGEEIKAQTLRQAIAGRTGSITGDNNNSGELDFTARNTQCALGMMFAEKAGAPAFDELKQSIEQGVKNNADVPRILAETLYSKLLDSEPISIEALSMLVKSRALEVVRELSTVGGIPPERLALKSPESQKSGPPSAGFSLDAMTTSQ